MHDRLIQSKVAIANAFATDCHDWFSGNRYGHMGKWQYMEPTHAKDPVRGAALWDAWEQLSGDNNMLHRQGCIIEQYAADIALLTQRHGPVTTLIDLGPGAEMSIKRNTLPFIDIYQEHLQSFVAVDVAKEVADHCSAYIVDHHPALDVRPVHGDFMQYHNINSVGTSVALMMGGTIGNFEAPQNATDSLDRMATRLKKLKTALPEKSYLLLGLEATQEPEIIYKDYDHPAHAVFEINIMHGIKRDILAAQDGFDPCGWRYAMKWWPEAHQFCHLAEATKDHRFALNDDDIMIRAGTNLVIDNSFKFPVLAMQKAARLAGIDYIRPFTDEDDRMVIHLLQM